MPPLAFVLLACGLFKYFWLKLFPLTCSAVVTTTVLSCDAVQDVGPDFRFKVQTCKGLSIWLDVIVPLICGHSHLLCKIKKKRDQKEYIYNIYLKYQKTSVTWIIQYWKNQKGMLLSSFGLEANKRIYWSAPYITVVSPPWRRPLLRRSLPMNTLFTCITTVNIWQSPEAIQYYTQSSLQLDRQLKVHSVQIWVMWKRWKSVHSAKVFPAKKGQRQSKYFSLMLPFPVAGTVLSPPCSWHTRLTPSTGTSCDTETWAGVHHN